MKVRRAAVGLPVAGVAVLGGALALAGVLPLVAVLLVPSPAGQAVTGVTKAALYRYAETGEQPAVFRDVDLRRVLGEGMWAVPVDAVAGSGTPSANRFRWWGTVAVSGTPAAVGSRPCGVVRSL